MHHTDLASLSDHGDWTPTIHTSSGLIKPELAGADTGYLPVVVVNPSLEMVTLQHDAVQNRWAVATVAHYGGIGFTALQGLLVRSNLPDLTDLALQLRLPDDGTSPSLVVELGDFPAWTVPLTHAIANQAQQQGGLVLVVTSVLDPHHADPGLFEGPNFARFLRSGKAGVGWLPVPGMLR